MFDESANSEYRQRQREQIRKEVRDMKLKKKIIYLVIALLISLSFLSACSKTPKKTALKVIIIPKFEIEEMSGDFPGEAQLFYEGYCKGCEEVEIPHMTPEAHFYVNEKSGVGLLVTGSGKTAAGLSLMAVLDSDLYDYSDSYIVSVGCGGGNLEETTLGDVVVVTAACDYDLGHHVEAVDMEDPDAHVNWFPDDSFAEYNCEIFNEDLSEKVFQMVKDIPVQTTETAKEVLEKNFPDYEEALREPSVIKGTAVSGDNFWKGESGHNKAIYIADHYGCPDPYAVTEMEEIAIANAAECFGMLDRIISLRVIVNADLFSGNETPESLWGDAEMYNEKVREENSETLDIFEPAMHNLYDVSSVVIDAIVAGEF